MLENKLFCRTTRNDNSHVSKNKVCYMPLIFYQWQCFISIIPHLLFYLVEKIQVKKSIYCSHKNIAKLPFSVHYSRCIAQGHRPHSR